MVLLVSQSVSAQQPDREQARAAFAAGVQAFSAENYGAALESFAEAFRIAPHPSVRVNMANCYDRLQRPAEALDAFEDFLRDPGTASAEQISDARAAVQRLSAQVGTLVLDVHPSGAEVFVDATSYGVAPLATPVRLSAGEHQLIVRSAGFDPHVAPVQIAPAREQLVTVTLAPLAAVREEGPALTVASPEAESERADSSATGMGAGFWVSTVLGVAFAGAAVGFGVAALGSEAEYEDLAAQVASSATGPVDRELRRAEAIEAADAADRNALISDLCTGGAVVAAIVAVVFAVRSGKGEDESAVAVRPLASGSFAGVSLAGAF